MTLPDAMAGLMWLGVTFYALFAGADFGAGFWDLVAGGAQRGRRQRETIEHSIGPVWEANHVWLIFVLVIMWTCFPALFGDVASTLYVPLSAAAFGVIVRGSAFAFRKTVTALWHQRLLGAGFAVSSVITPFFLGAAAGAVASGRVPPRVGGGPPISSWWNPMSAMTGALAVATCAYLAAVYLAGDARRSGDPELAAQFRARALGAGVAAGLIAAAGLAFLHHEASLLFHGLTHRGLPLVLLSGAAGAVSLALLYRRWVITARLTAALAVAAVLWAWALAQYPHLLEPSLTIAAAAAAHEVLVATAICMAVGAVILIPSLAWLYSLFQRTPPTPDNGPASRDDHPAPDGDLLGDLLG